MENNDNRKDILIRLQKIEGQVRGIHKNGRKPA